MNDSSASARRKKTLARHRLGLTKKVEPAQAKHWAVGLAEIVGVVLLSIVLWVGISAWLSVPHHISMLRPYSYWAVFLLSLVGSALVLIPTFPVQIAIVALGRTLTPWGVGLAAGIGSGIGELTSYGLGLGGQEILKGSPKWARWIIDVQHKLVKKYAGAAIFVLALIPDPLFGVVGIAAGLSGVSVWEFLLYTILGRIVHYALLAYLAASLGTWTHLWF